jgi:hypothetical protein
VFVLGTDAAVAVTAHNPHEVVVVTEQIKLSSRRRPLLILRQTTHQNQPMLGRGQSCPDGTKEVLVVRPAGILEQALQHAAVLELHKHGAVIKVHQLDALRVNGPRPVALKSHVSLAEGRAATCVAAALRYWDFLVCLG